METPYSQICRTWQRMADRVGGTFAEEPFIEPSSELFDFLPSEIANVLQGAYKAGAAKLMKTCGTLRVPYKNWLIVMKTDVSLPTPDARHKIAVRADYVPLSSFRLLFLPAKQLPPPALVALQESVMGLAGKFFKANTSTTRQNDPKFRSGDIDLDSAFQLFGNDASRAVKFCNTWHVREALLGLTEPMLVGIGLSGYVAKQINVYQMVNVVDRDDTMKTIEFIKLALDTLAAQGLVATEPSSTESASSR